MLVKMAELCYHVATMIDDHRRFRIGLLDGGHIEVEVNFDKSDKVSESKVLRLFIDGKTFDVIAKDLVSFLVLVGDVGVKKDLIPAKITKVRKQQRLLRYSFKASKDYKKGEVITVDAPYIDTHTDVEEVVAGAVKNALKNKSPIIT